MTRGKMLKGLMAGLAALPFWPGRRPERAGMSDQEFDQIMADGLETARKLSRERAEFDQIMEWTLEELIEYRK